MSKAKEKKPSRMGMVRQAIKDGITDNQKIVEYCSKSGVEATLAQVSTYKSIIKNGKPKQDGAKKSFRLVTSYTTGPIDPPRPIDYAGHVAAMKSAVNEMGREQARRILELV
jgi:hypothetical protein